MKKVSVTVAPLFPWICFLDVAVACLFCEKRGQEGIGKKQDEPSVKTLCGLHLFPWDHFMDVVVACLFVERKGKMRLWKNTL